MAKAEITATLTSLDALAVLALAALPHASLAWRDGVVCAESTIKKADGARQHFAGVGESIHEAYEAMRADSARYS